MMAQARQAARRKAIANALRQEGQIIGLCSWVLACLRGCARIMKTASCTALWDFKRLGRCKNATLMPFRRDLQFFCNFLHMTA